MPAKPTGPFCACGAPGRWCCYCNGVTCQRHHSKFADHSASDATAGVRDYGYGGITWQNGRRYP